jgi:hypothetical protein
MTLLSGVILFLRRDLVLYRRLTFEHSKCKAQPPIGLRPAKLPQSVARTWKGSTLQALSLELANQVSEEADYSSK